MAHMTKVRLRPHPHKGALGTWLANPNHGLAAVAMLLHLSHQLTPSDSNGRELCAANAGHNSPDPPASFRHNCFNMFVPTEVFIKHDTQVLKLSNTLYSRPIVL